MLVDALSSLPSIGKKSARKLAFFLLDQDQKYIHEFTNRIVNAKKNIKRCVACNNISLNSLCSICSNSNRDNSTLCVVPTTEDLDKIEFSGCYNGLYFVINGELTNKKSDMNLVEANIRVLANRIKDDSKIINLIIQENIQVNIFKTVWVI